ncbi:hypothetical protein NLM33_10745 [Bradyrhizobium sp. CCGUVB1N3]|uniref:hypothetical protein n=1 Tax=Bradyrhizobium sp. CCGUVB1N3 TaxID=2949629 RepID=UPI0020B2DB4D|nr:hypothetical protein [Bradyrhizobium sp. CCGUVB1N3]MCP3470798.1 hypothetical protein [Bradyrhizobium sp. CCGUVB1N3]
MQKATVHVAAVILVLVAAAAAYAKGSAHGGGLAAPANPAVPPTLTSNSHLLDYAPLPAERQVTRSEDPSLARDLGPTREESDLDSKLAICRGC